MRADQSPAPTASAPPLRSVLMIYFPMFIAVLSLSSSIYQGYLFHESLQIVQRNVARGEYMRTCREIIETYFLVKQRVGLIMPAGDRDSAATATRGSDNDRVEAQSAVARFGALGTYLANFQEEATRARYTELTRTLMRIVDAARATQISQFDKLFEPADRLFTQMNDDCVRLSNVVRM